MLVPIVFILVLMLALSTALLESSASAAKTALNRSMERYSEIAVSDGTIAFTAGLATFVKAHGSGGPWPQAPSRSFPKPLCASSIAPQDCPYSYVIDAAITGTSGGPLLAQTADDAAINLQTSVIGEERVSARVTATIAAQNGTVFATRTRFVTYRVLGAAPYAIVSALRDAGSRSGARAIAPGDSGGDVFDPAAARDGAVRDDAVHDTRIHVQLTCKTAIANLLPLVNDQQHAGNDGLPWGKNVGAAYETPCHQIESPADAFADKAWTNGNAQTSGWTP